jgi:hypothetical protein
LASAAQFWYFYDPSELDITLPAPVWRRLEGKTKKVVPASSNQTTQ